MRVFLVIDETPFFHPGFISGVIERCPDEIVGAALITKISDKNNIGTWLRRNWFHLRPWEIFKLVWRSATASLREMLGLSKPGAFYSVRSVLRHHGIDFKEVHYDINKPEYLDFIRAKSPEVILSSCSLIFKADLLRIPSKGCINRHSGLLPAFRGLWPVFQAYRNGETQTGVSVHTMEVGIDKGIVLSQKTTPIVSGLSLYGLYDICFRLSIDAVLEALDKLRSGNLQGVRNDKPQSYYSFPTSEHWKQFRARGGKFI